MTVKRCEDCKYYIPIFRHGYCELHKNMIQCYVKSCDKGEKE